jgi:hypothetical protein
MAFSTLKQATVSSETAFVPWQAENDDSIERNGLFNAFCMPWQAEHDDNMEPKGLFHAFPCLIKQKTMTAWSETTFSIRPNGLLHAVSS